MEQNMIMANMMELYKKSGITNSSMEKREIIHVQDKRV
jgi:hypothetical protein